jgi:heat shock protein HtpX
MENLYTHQSGNIAKTWFLMAVFFIFIIALGWLFSNIYGNPALLYGAVLFSIIMNVASYWWSDKVVIKMTGARLAERKDYFELFTIVENLSITAGLPMPKVYVIEDSAPNAFATGRNKNHAVVAVTTGLLAVLDKTELEGVIAHELSHIGNRDMLLSTAVVVLVGFVSILADLFLRTAHFGGLGNDRDSKAGGALLLLGVIAAILAPISATLIQLAISRKREFLADSSGALLTRYPEGLASALAKIGSSSRPMARANTATAHLFIANPFGPNRKFFVKLFMTHPPIEERISALVGEREQ